MSRDQDREPFKSSSGHEKTPDCLPYRKCLINKLEEKKHHAQHYSDSTNNVTVIRVELMILKKETYIHVDSINI